MNNTQEKDKDIKQQDASKQQDANKKNPSAQDNQQGGKKNDPSSVRPDENRDRQKPRAVNE